MNVRFEPSYNDANKAYQPNLHTSRRWIRVSKIYIKRICHVHN